MTMRVRNRKNVQRPLHAITSVKQLLDSMAYPCESVPIDRMIPARTTHNMSTRTQQGQHCAGSEQNVDDVPFDLQAKAQRNGNQQAHERAQNTLNRASKHWRCGQAAIKGETPTTIRNDGRKMLIEATTAPGSPASM
jgi:hypothetical protein